MPLPWEGKEVDNLVQDARKLQKNGELSSPSPWEGKEVDDLVDSAEELVTAEMRL